MTDEKMMPCPVEITDYAEVCKELGCVPKPGVALRFIQDLRKQLANAHERQDWLLRSWDDATITERQELDRLRQYVMSFKRWGMSGAEPVFQPRRGKGMVPASELVTFEVGDRGIVGVDAAKADGSVYRFDIRGIDCADARLIEAAPAIHAALIALNAENERLRKALKGMLEHSCVADSAWEDKCAEDHDAERAARAALSAREAK